MDNKSKKTLKAQQIKLGKTRKKERRALWEYILHNDLGVGYYDAQELARHGIHVIKTREYDIERPD